MKVFLSQPMRDRLPEVIETERMLIFDTLRKKHPGEEIEEVKSYDPSLRKMDPIYSLGFSIQMLAQADLVVFAPNWETARGCRIEHAVCLDYGKEHLDLSDHFGKD